MSAIEVVLGRQILDSRGNPTVEADVHLESGAFGRLLLKNSIVEARLRLALLGLGLQ